MNLIQFTMKRVFIVVMVGRLNYLPPDLTMNKLSSQTILNITTNILRTL